MLVTALVLAALTPLILVLGPRWARRPPSRPAGASGSTRHAAIAVAAAMALLGASVPGTVTALEQRGDGLQTRNGASDVTVQAGEAVTGTAEDCRDGCVGYVSGRVIDASGDGISDVTLSIRSMDTPYVTWLSDDLEPVTEGTTDADGSYTFGPFNAGNGLFVMTVSAPDDRYVDTWHAFSTRGSGHFRLDDIRLGPGGTVSGRVRDPAGAVISGMDVQVCVDASWLITGHLYEPWCLSSASDDAGDFVFEGVPAHTYRVGMYDRFGEFVAASVTVADGGHERLELVAVPFNYQFEGSFYDDEGSVHEASLDAVAGRRITAATECGRGRICHEDGISRSVMAVWFGRALLRAEPSTVQASRFADVDIGGKHAFEAPHIERFADLGITAGCATEPLRFCPDRTVTRAEMATFMLRALDLEVPDEPAGFTDVDRGSVHARSIDALAAAGITVGCNRTGTRFCPNQDVTRGEMATFINRVLPRLDDQLENLVFLSARVIDADTRVSVTAEQEQPTTGSDLYRFEVPAGGASAVIETHGEQDLYASLSRSVPGAPDEQVAQDDDGGEDLNSRIALDYLKPGWYIIEIECLCAPWIADYEISIISVTSINRVRPLLSVGVLVNDAFENGALLWTRMIDADMRVRAEGDQEQPLRANGDVHWHWYWFEVPAGGASAVVETHGGQDLYAWLSRSVPGAPDELLAQDDDGGEDLNSRIALDYLTPGSYIIEIECLCAPWIADYEISVTLE